MSQEVTPWCNFIGCKRPVCAPSKKGRDELGFHKRNVYYNLLYLWIHMLHIITSLVDPFNSLLLKLRFLPVLWDGTSAVASGTVDFHIVCWVSYLMRGPRHSDHSNVAWISGVSWVDTEFLRQTCWSNHTTAGVLGIHTKLADATIKWNAKGQRLLLNDRKNWWITGLRHEQW